MTQSESKAKRPKAVADWHEAREELESEVGGIWAVDGDGEFTVGRETYADLQRVALRLAQPASELAILAAPHGLDRPFLALARAARELPPPLCWPCREAVAELHELARECDLALEQFKLRAAQVAAAAPVKASNQQPEQDARAMLDVAHDPDCDLLRDLLKTGPKSLGQIGKDQRCRVSRRRVSDLLRAMRAAGMVTQTRSRGPWRLIDNP